MKLTVLERLKLLQVLPVEGNITKLRIVRRLREALSFSEREIQLISLVEKDGRATWENELDRDYEFKPVATALIVETLQALEASNKLTMEHLSLAEKFLAQEQDQEDVVCDAPVNRIQNREDKLPANGAKDLCAAPTDGN